VIDPLRPHFQHCPRCGRPGFNRGGPALDCEGCQFQLYLNPAVAAAGLIFDEHGRLLVIRRAKDPGKGLFAVPGGFVDKGETAEAAVAREIREEVGLEVTALRYLLSHVNSYQFRGVTYSVLDLFYEADVASLDVVHDPDELSGWHLEDLHAIDLEQIAFESMRAAIRLARARRPR
jgi:ADP-ribose pyrophosphatase